MKTKQNQSAIANYQKMVKNKDLQIQLLSNKNCELEDVITQLNKQNFGLQKQVNQLNGNVEDSLGLNLTAGESQECRENGQKTREKEDEQLV